MDWQIINPEMVRRFETVKNQVLLQNPGENGIGTYREKALHRILKNYIEPEPEKQEVRLKGFVADIYTGSEIKEVQTRNLSALKRKLDTFLKVAPVTIIHPVSVENYINWVDPESGSLKERRKSSKKGSIYTTVQELIYIKKYLKDPGLSFRFIFLKTEEYRLLDGYGRQKKYHATKAERLPMELLYEASICERSDYRIFLPPGLPEEFTSMDYREGAKVSIDLSRAALNFLSAIGIIEKIGKRGRLFLYREI